MHIHVIHENAAWLEPLARALDAEHLPWREWFLDAARSTCRSRRRRACSTIA